jgi:cyanophycinase-like exopeptidase
LLDGGGTDIDAAWRWMHDTLVGKATRGGNVLILRATGTDDYDPYALQTARFASARTLLVPACTPRAQVDALAKYADAADAVFFSGGDQAHYAAWKGSALISAVRRAYARGGVVGGTSAGLAIQGAVVYDSVAADRVLAADAEVRSPDATKNPYEPAISFTTGLFRYPPLTAVITDTHFAKRDRFGRLAAFMARALRDGLIRGNRVYGVAVDERSALVVDRHGVATLLENPYAGGYRTRGAYIITGGRAARIAPGKPLLYTVHVVHLSRSGQRFNLYTKHGDGRRYDVTVDGSRSSIYSRDPYSG